MSQEAESLRRQDRPHAVLALLKDAPLTFPVVLEQAAAHLELGQLNTALHLGFSALGLARTPQEHTVALDLRAGVFIIQGRLGDAREAIEAMEGAVGQVASWMRDAQLARLQGDLPRVHHQLNTLQDNLPVIEATAGAHGEANLLQAECAWLQDQDPTPFLDEAQAAFQVAGRRAPLFRVEAQRAALCRDTGLSVAFPGLDRALEYCEERGILLTEIGIRMATSPAEALAMAQQIGAWVPVAKAVYFLSQTRDLIPEEKALLTIDVCLWKRLTD